MFILVTNLFVQAPPHKYKGDTSHPYTCLQASTYTHTSPLLLPIYQNLLSTVSFTFITVLYHIYLHIPLEIHRKIVYRIIVKRNNVRYKYYIYIK